MSPFVRHDMRSTDPEASTRFYVELFGWSAETIVVPRVGTMARLRAGGAVVGAVVPDAESQGQPSQWIPSIAAASAAQVEAIVKRAAALGGSTRVAPMEVANVGRVAHLVDPTGALFLVLAPAHDAARAPPNAPSNESAFAWDELHVTDAATLALARGFYTELFGWRAEIHAHDEATYTTFEREHAPFAGAIAGEHAIVAIDGRARWLPYACVPSVDAAAEHALELGAELLVAPDEIAEVGRYAVLRDPTEAMFALLARSR